MGKKKNNGAGNQFDASSTRFCTACKIDVKIGFGGEANWQIHLASMAHEKQERLSNTSQSITSFFQAKAAKAPAGQHPTTAQPPDTILSGKLPFITVNPSSFASGSLDSETVEPSTLLDKLRQATENLPLSVSLANSTDVLARFSGDPRSELEGGDEPWEMVDRALNLVIGFGATIEEVTAIIRRGAFGMDGMHNWLTICVRAFKIDEILLETKIQRLINAMIVLGSNLDAPVAQEASETPVSLPLKKSTFASETTCPGYHLQFPEGQTAFGSYPFLIHSMRNLPWEVFTKGEHFFLRSIKCTNIARTSKTAAADLLPCTFCSDLHNHSIIMGTRHRSADGAHEKTPWGYLGPANMHAALTKKTEEVKRLKLQALNTLRMIGVRNQHLDAWKRLSMAISQENIPRIRSLLATAHRAGSSVFSMIEKVSKAARRVYSPRGYAEADYKLAYLIYKIGGRSAANIAHKALGIPSIDTSKEHIATSPLASSPKFPTHTELHSNVSLCYPAPSPTWSTQEGRKVIKGMIMQVDELKIQERLRWDPRSNQILGVCREHSTGKCSLDFRSIHQADEVLGCLKSKTVHLATEATVIGASILSKDPNEYTTKAFAISGSCKQESVTQQEKLLRDASEALKENQTLANYCRLYCLGSDGDSRRRRALIAITLCRELDCNSNIYPILSQLPLFNLKCGVDDLTSDFDWKHVLKRFRNTLLRQKGFSIDGVAISNSVLKVHLIANGMSSTTADTILAPNDKQDVVLMIKLLHAIALLPQSHPEDRPLVEKTRRILRLLGRVYWNLLEAYMDVRLSLNEQLDHLSAAAHLILAIYNTDKGEFIPVQTCFDVMSMIKNIYFCVAKTQVDDPDGEFWIILLGTDGLEKVFGKVRTMVGNDTNADQLQLTNRIDGAVKCVNILEEHPEWGGQSRRLSVKPLPNDATEVSSKYDHISPKAWIGDVHVATVALDGCWSSGRRSAEAALEDAGVNAPFEKMESVGGFDILCPFGSSKMMLADGKLAAGEREESEEERDDTQLSDATFLPSPGIPRSPETSESPADTLGSRDHDDLISLDDELEPDFDDVTGLTDASNLGNKPPPYDPWVLVDGKKVHKATILRLYSNPFAVSDSKDRLKRVRGFSQYNETSLPNNTGSSETPPLTVASDGDNPDIVCVQDPILTLVRCNKQVFLALIQITGIRYNSATVETLPARYLHEPNVRLSGQVMKLALLDASHQPDGPDWEWNSAFEARSMFQLAEGNWFELINPVMQLASRGRNAGKDTYAFRTSELRAIAALLYQRLEKDLHRLPEVPQTSSFPYRSVEGYACFLCEKDTVDGDHSRETDLDSCRLCRKVSLSKLTGPALITHMGGHILHDLRLRDQANPCGFCLNTGSLCIIKLNITSKVTTIDMKASRCPHLRKITVKTAATFTPRSPCTNHPLVCPLCPEKSPAIWKYNFRAHIVSLHPTANPDLYQRLFELHKDEHTLMKAQFQAVPRQSKTSKQVNVLPASDAHSSRFALRETSGPMDVDEDQEEAEEQDEISEEDGDHDEEMMPLTNDPHEPQPSAMAPPDLLSRPRKRRGAPNEVDGDDENPMCADDGCETTIKKVDLLRCDAPGCELTYHLSCQGLLEKPSGGWFCDDECKKNAGWRVGSRKRRKKD